MTTATFEMCTGAGAILMDVKGHAGFAELGKDPVCAGASVLAMTVAQCAEDMYGYGKLQKKPAIMIRNGRVRVVVKPEPEYYHEALHLYWIAYTGMRLLAESYPENMELKGFETVVETVPGDEAGTTQESGADSI